MGVGGYGVVPMFGPRHVCHGIANCMGKLTFEAQVEDFERLGKALLVACPQIVEEYLR